MKNDKLPMFISKTIGVKPDCINYKRTNVKKRTFVTLPLWTKTEYFAKKRTAEIALRLFVANKDWNDVFIEVEYRNELKSGIVQADITRSSFLKAWRIDEDRIDEEGYLDKVFWKNKDLHKKDVIEYAEHFTVTRLSRYLSSGGTAEGVVKRFFNNRRNRRKRK